MMHMLMSVFKHYFYKIAKTPRAIMGVWRRVLYILGLLYNVKDAIRCFGAASLTLPSQATACTSALFARGAGRIDRKESC